MPKLSFYVSINDQELLKYYRGHAKNVRVVANTGQRVQFPAESLRPFVSTEGVRGQFEIEFSEEGKMKSIKRISQ